jgi:hypothetical protein
MGPTLAAAVGRLCYGRYKAERYKRTAASRMRNHTRSDMNSAP